MFITAYYGSRVIGANTPGSDKIYHWLQQISGQIKISSEVYPVLAYQRQLRRDTTLKHSQRVGNVHAESGTATEA